MCDQYNYVPAGILKSKDDLEGITTSFAECIEDSSKCGKPWTWNGAIISAGTHNVLGMMS